MHMSPSTRAAARCLRALTVLTMIALMAVPMTAQANPLWCSPFETEGGVPVTNNKVADVVDNNVGAPGQATGNLATLDPLIYIPHGVFVSDVPASIDPADQAQGFCLSTPDDRRTGFNTGLRSNAGDLANNLTFEGYFFMASGEPVLDPTFVGRRLVTQKRSADDAQSRLAVGIHAHSELVGYVDGLFDYEGFDYAGGALVGQSGGVGWAGPWVNPSSGGFTTDNLSNDGASLSSDIFPFTPVGSRFSATGGHISRPLGRPINLELEGQTTYLSALMLKTSTEATAGDNLEIGLATSANVSSTGSTIRTGITSGDQFFTVVSGQPAGTVVAGTPYFIVLKIVSHATDPDEVYLNVYEPGQAVPETEPDTWLISQTLSSSAVLTHLKLTVGANLVLGEVDEIRIGSTYASVTDPDAPLGDPGQVITENKLAVFWAEQTPPEEPEGPFGLVNHLELGTTTLVANTWYHFALVYDGAEIRWYLDGQLEGQVAAPPATDTTPGLYPAGPATMAVANNRSRGAQVDRGFFGLIDEIRIYDRALTPSEMLVQGAAPGDNLLWQSRFETNLQEPVTSGQPAESPNCIDNEVGPPHGTPAGVVASLYAAYGQPDVPPIPASLDPAGLAGDFAILMSEAPNTAIDTHVPSNAGNFANAVTIQGYFNSFMEFPVGPTAVGARLVSMQRSAMEGNARLGIGLASNGQDPPANVLSVAWHNGSAVIDALGSTPIEPFVWHHFALVWDGTDIRWYLDGQLEGEVLSAPLMGPGSANIAIGNDRTTGAGTRGFYGLMDKVVISDHVIDPSQFMTQGFDGCLSIFCNTPFADLDGDTDVDPDDLGLAQRCYTGVTTGVTGECLCLDRNTDDRIDALDMEEWSKCRTAANVPWDASLTPGCTP